MGHVVRLVSCFVIILRVVTLAAFSPYHTRWCFEIVSFDSTSVLEAQLQDISEFPALLPPNPLGKDAAKKWYAKIMKLSVLLCKFNPQQVFFSFV